jgi:predicted ester cyclase
VGLARAAHAPLQDDEALAHEALALLWGGDDARIAEIVAPGYRDHAATGLDRGPLSFRTERQALRDAFADVEVTAHGLIVGDGHAIARVRFRGLHVGRYAQLDPCGRSLEWDEIHIWRLEAGRLAEHWACRDDLAALCRAGAVMTWAETDREQRRT